MVITDDYLDAMADPLGDHQPVNAVGGQVLHVAVEEAGAASIQDTIAITDDRPDSRPGAGYGALADAFRHRAQVHMTVDVLRTAVELIRVRELINGNLVLIGMAGPGTVHEAVGLVLLVLLEHGEGARV